MLCENVESLTFHYLSASNVRNEKLFTKFLPRGYTMTTQSCSRSQHFQTIMFAKMSLGMLITLYDDLADNPDLRNPGLLREMYLLLESPDLNSKFLEHSEYILAKNLLDGLFNALSKLPGNDSLINVFNFDLREIFMANRYSEMIATTPEAANLKESAHHGPYNMGIVAAGTIDLMGVEDLALDALGSCREVFLLAQRAGRISNFLTTYDREQAEGDPTNEMDLAIRCSDSKKKKPFVALYEDELRLCLDKIQTFQNDVPFNVNSYAKAFEDFHRLHREMEGQI